MAPDWTRGKCLIYGRVSKETQDGGMKDQVRVIRDFMRQAKLELIGEPFEDDARRGHDESRPGLLAVKEYVKRHPNPVRKNSDYIPVLVYDVARFGRFDDPKKFMWYATEVERYGYEFYSVCDGIRSRGDITDFINLVVRGGDAYTFSVNLSAYGIRTGCSLASDGWWPGGNAPYGYDRMTYGLDGKPKYRYVTLPDKTVEKRTSAGKMVESLPPVNDRGALRSAYSDKLRTDKVRLVPNPLLAKNVKLIFRWFTVEDQGLKAIAARLNRTGVPAPRGRRWLKSSVRGILENHAYRGAVVYGRRSDGKHHDIVYEKMGDGYVPRIDRRDHARREFVHRRVEDCVVKEGCHEALVTSETWNTTCRKLGLRKRGVLGNRGKGGRGSSYLLSGDGLMKCSHCGYHFHGSTDRRTKIRYYLDGGYHMGGRDVCAMTLVGAEAFEGVILKRIREKLFDGNGRLRMKRETLVSAIEQGLAEEGASQCQPDPEREALHRRLVKLEKQREDAERLHHAFPGQTKDLLQAVRAEEEEVRKKLGPLKAPTSASLDVQQRRQLAQKIATYRVDFEAAFKQGTPEERKRFIRDFVASIEVNGRERKIRVGFYSAPGKVALRVVPPRGH